MEKREPSYTVQFSSVTQLCPTLCDPMNCSTPGLPVHHHLQEFTQIHIHRVRDAIQPSDPLSSSSPPAPNPSQHQNLFQWVSSSHEVAKVLELQLQHHSFQRNSRVDLLQNGLFGSPCSPRDSQESSPTPQFLLKNSETCISFITTLLFFYCLSFLSTSPHFLNQQLFQSALQNSRRRKWQPTPVFSPEESHGWRNLSAYSPQGGKELDMTDVTQHAHVVGFEGRNLIGRQNVCFPLVTRLGMRMRSLKNFT